MRGFRICLAAASLSGGMAFADTALSQADDTEAIRSQLENALANIQFARCGTEVRCAPATAEEKADPPLTLDEATKVLDRGALSGIAKVCAMNWIDDSFHPMIEYWRGQGKSDRQIALIGILHGMALVRVGTVLGSRPCTDKLRRDVQARLPKLP